MKFPGLGSREKRTAIVDIGSNSVRLVVYRGPNRIPAILFNEKVMAGLGRELSTTGAIDAEAMATGLSGLRRFWQLCREMEVDRIYSFATAAVRDASNGGEFLSAAQAIGFKTTILQGEEEAELAALGVVSAIPGARGIVGDLGGGSLELAYVEEGQVQEKYSFPLGVLRIAQQRASDKRRLKRQIRKMLKETGWDKSRQNLPFYLVGGSWRSLARVDMFDSGYPLPMIHQYEMAPERARRLVRRLAQADRSKLKTVHGLSSSRIPTLPDAAWLLSFVVRYLNASRLIVSAYGVREGMLFKQLEAADRNFDPLILATQDTGAEQARFSANSKLLGRWIAPIFADDPDEWQRIRQAACNLGDVAWRANPDFRAERGLEMGLHGNWVAIDGPEREMLGQALYTSFGGGTKIFPGGGQLANEAATKQAICWGLAMRLGQRISAGTRHTLDASRLARNGENLELLLPKKLESLYGHAVERRHRQLAHMLNMNPIMIVD